MYGTIRGRLFCQCMGDRPVGPWRVERGPE